MAHKLNVRVLALILAVIAIFTCFVSCSDKQEDGGQAETTQQQQQTGTFVPPEFDKGVIKGTPYIKNPQAVGYSELDAQAYKLSICGKVTVEDGKADIYFTNPKSNDVWLKLRIFNEAGEIIAETGLVCPGEYLQTITFDKVPASGDKITIKVMGYEPHTYYSAGAADINTVVS